MYLLDDSVLYVFEMDYPNELYEFSGRKIWPVKMIQVTNQPDMLPVFVKPVEDKKITGIVVRSPKDLVRNGTCGEEPDTMCSEIVNFIAEWRCY